nr:MFS transporter [uncultured Bacillus sp.]
MAQEALQPVNSDPSQKKGFHWKARYSVLTAIWVGWMLSFLDRSVISISLPFIGKDLNIDATMQGAILSAFFAGYALFQIPGGLLADKFGFRRIMAIGITWWSLFTAITGMMVSYPLMLVCRSLFGIGEGCFPGATWKAIATYFPPKQRATATSIQSTVNTLGPAFATLLAASAIHAFGWRPVFIAIAIPGVLVGIYSWKYIKDNPADHGRMTSAELAELKGDEKTEQSKDASGLTFREFIKKPILWQLAGIWFLFDITFWGYTSWLPSYLMNERGFSLLQAGIAGSIPYLFGAAGTLLGGWLSDRVKSYKKWLFVPGALIAGYFLYLTYTVTSSNTAVVYQCISSLFMFLAMASFWGIVMDSIPAHIMGSSSSTVNFGGQVAGFISPFVMGYLIQASGGSYDNAFIFIIAAMVASACLTLTIRRGKQ